MSDDFFADKSTSKPSLLVNKLIAAVKENVTFTCEATNDNGLPKSSYFTIYKVSSSPNIHNGSSSWTRSFDTVKDTDDYYCTVGNYVGSSGTQSHSLNLQVQGEF